MSFIPRAVRPLIEDHAIEAAFLWATRDDATHSPAYDLFDLGELDGRIAAHLDGLRIAEQVGADVAFELLEEAMEPGEAFVAATLVLERGDAKGFARVLDLVEADPALWRAMPSAVGFCEVPRVEQVLRALTVASVPAPLRRMGLAGYAAHRRHPGDALGRGLADADPTVRVRALKAVGELGAREHLEALQGASAAEGEEERYWACRSLVLLGETSALAGLQRIAETARGRLAEHAARLVGCFLEGAALRRWVAEMDAAERRAIALFAAETSCDAGLLPWIVGCMHDETHARLAGHAFFAITGEAIDGDLLAEPPEGFDDEPDEEATDDGDEVELDPDDALPWPSASHAEGYLATLRLDVSTPLLLGKPVEPAWLRAVLRDGAQPQREVAAWRLGVRGGEGLFEIRAPAWRQRVALGLARGLRA